MKYCSKCGNILKEDDIFCSKCGAKASVFGVTKKPADAVSVKVSKKADGKVTKDTLGSTRYTAAVEKNAVAVMEYLKRASDLEWQRYETEAIGKELKTREQDCLDKIAGEEAAVKSYREKAEQTEKQIKDYKKLEYRRKVFNFRFTFDYKVFGAVFFGLLALYLIGGLAKIPPFSWIFKGVVAMSSPGGDLSRIILIFWLIFIPFAVMAVMQVVKYFRSKAEHEKEEDEATARYTEEQEQLEKDTLETLNNDLNDYNSIIAEHENEIARLKNFVLRGIREEVEANAMIYDDIVKSMEKFYSSEAIYPRYRSMVPVTTMYEYFVLGKCVDLTGHEGAYNTYEKELRNGLIKSDLKDIDGTIGEIPEAQRAAAAQLLKFKAELTSIMNSVDAAQNRNMTENPDGSKPVKRLKKSDILKSYYEDINSRRLSHMEYADTMGRLTRRLF